jgi:hypothetical protein
MQFMDIFQTIPLDGFRFRVIINAALPLVESLAEEAVAVMIYFQIHFKVPICIWTKESLSDRFRMLLLIISASSF